MRDGIVLSVRAEAGLLLDPDAAVPIALIVAETIANAIEHGLAGRERGAIEVALVRHEAGLRLEVCDDGHGLPEGFDLATSGSLGLGIVRTFAEQLGGTFEMLPGERTTARLTLPG
ncbi:MAG: ATP-binding protein [Sphingomonas sp.]